MTKDKNLEDKVNEALYRALNLVNGRVVYPATMSVHKIEDAGDMKVVSVEAEATSVFELPNLDLFRSYFKENLDDLGIELVSAKVAIVKKGLGLSLVVR